MLPIFKVYSVLFYLVAYIYLPLLTYIIKFSKHTFTRFYYFLRTLRAAAFASLIMLTPRVPV